MAPGLVGIALGRMFYTCSCDVFGSAGDFDLPEEFIFVPSDGFRVGDGYLGKDCLHVLPRRLPFNALPVHLQRQVFVY